MKPLHWIAKPSRRALGLAPLGVALLLMAGCAGLKPGGAASGPAAVSAASAPSIGGSVTSQAPPALQAQRTALADALESAGVSVLVMPDGQLQLNVPSDFSFGSDRSEIRPEGRPVLDKVAASLLLPDFVALRVRVVGHTDSQGGEAHNDALSLARAASVRRHLESKGVASTRLQAIGRGEREPLAPNDKDYGRALNRRIEIYLQAPGVAP